MRLVGSGLELGVILDADVEGSFGQLDCLDKTSVGREAGEELPRAARHAPAVGVGPADAPAGIKDLETAADCFAAIAEAGTGFASRGDNSGTHNKETSIWEAAEIDPSAESWYSSLGSGMGDTLTKANEMNVYALTDKATFLSMKDSLPNLAILKEEADDMKNTYSLLGVNPDAAAFADTDVTINTEGANALIEWLLSDEAAELIAQYGVEQYGEQLFFLLDK